MGSKLRQILIGILRLLLFVWVAVPLVLGVIIGIVSALMRLIVGSLVAGIEIGTEGIHNLVTKDS